MIKIRLDLMMGEIKTIGVVGSGQMGSGIAQLGAVHGLDVWLLDTDPGALSRATKSISASIHRMVSKGHLSQVTNLLTYFIYMNCLVYLYLFIYFFDNL